MVFVYILQSLVDNTWYVGMAIDPLHRLKEHNAGRNRFTKGHRPWKIIFTEPHQDWASARVREKYFKTAGGKRWLRARLSNN
jgi:predicted GIY-YIG superfamily endonuclease